MPMADRVPFWRKMPPAVFPPIMGLFGLALAWRRAVEALLISPAISALILGGVAVLFVFATGSYLAKVCTRVRVLVEDSRVLPGLAGLSAMSLSGMLLAAGLVPVAPGLATGILAASLVFHLVVAGLAAYRLVTAPPEARLISPATHLTFVGFIVAPLAALPLGFTLLAKICFFVTLPLAAAVYLVSLRQMLRRAVTPMLRPLLAIHLAPMTLFGIAAEGLDLPAAALVFGGLSLVTLFVLVARTPYLTQAGFSPLWGAFTFPLAAFASLMLLLGEEWDGFRLLGSMALVAATMIVPAIAFQVMKLWARGVLSARTNAAVA